MTQRSLFFCALLWTSFALAQSYEDELAKSRAAATAQQYAEAQAAAQKAIALDEKRWEAYVLAANAYSSQHLNDDAIGMLQMALPRAPEDKKPLVRNAISEARGKIASPTAGVTSPSARTRPPTTSTTQAEVVLWKSIENSTRVEDFQAYLESYPSGAYAPIARARISKSEAIATASKLNVPVVRGPVGAIPNQGMKCLSSMTSFVAVGSSVQFDTPKVGRFQIGSDNATYIGPDTTVSIQKEAIVEIRSEGPLIVFYSDDDLWSFAPVDEADAQHHCIGSGGVAKTIGEQWRFVPTSDGRLLPFAGAPGALVVNTIYRDRGFGTFSFRGPLQITADSMAFWSRDVAKRRISILKKDVEHIEVSEATLAVHTRGEKFEFGSLATPRELLNRISERWGELVPNKKGTDFVLTHK